MTDKQHDDLMGVLVLIAGLVAAGVVFLVFGIMFIGCPIEPLRVKIVQGQTYQPK